MKQKVIMNKKGLSHIDFAIAVGVTMTVIAFVLSFVTNYMSPSFVLAKTADLKASADSLQQMLFDTSGIPASWEDSSRAPVRVGLKTSIYKLPLQIKDGAGINRSLESIDMHIIFDQDCKNITYNNSLRLFDEFLNETSFKIYNATECANNSGFLKEANIVFIANNSANARKAYFFFYSNKTSVAWSNYSNIYDSSVVGYWKFEAVNTTNHTLDESRYKNDGKLYNGSASCYSGAGCPALAAGKFGYGMQFDGVDDYVDAGDDNSLKPTNEITVESWIYPKGTTDRGWKQTIAGSEDGAYGYVLRGGNIADPDTYASLNFAVGNGTSWNDQVPCFTPLNLNTWYHVVGVVKANDKIYIYINGQECNNGSFSGNPAQSSRPFRVGSLHKYPTRTFNGTIDEVKIYNRSLSATEIQQEYNLSASRYVSAEKTSAVSKFKVTAMQSLSYDDVRVSLGLKNHFNVTMCGYSFGRQPPEQVDVVSYQKPVLFWNSTGVASSCIATLSMW